jgi:hypothetical protein
MTIGVSKRDDTGRSLPLRPPIPSLRQTLWVPGRITRKNHLRQESEWEGEIWGKNADFFGLEEFGAGQRKPGEIRDPGTNYEYNDVRIDRLALSLARVFG